jgi:hypothetical protein
MNRTRSMGMRSLMNSLEQTGVEARPVQDETLDDAVEVTTHSDVFGLDARAAKMAEIEARANIVSANRYAHRPILRRLY